MWIAGHIILAQILGHILNVNGDDGADVDKVRNALCGQINNVLSYFGHVFPVLKLKLIKTFVIVCTVQFCGN